MTSSTLPTRLVGTRTVFDDTVDVLGGFRPGYPKFYSIADLGSQSRRRWVPLEQAVEGGRDRLPADEDGREERAEAAQRLALDRSVGRRRGSQLSLQGAFDLAPMRDEPGGEDAIRLHETGV